VTCVVLPDSYELAVWCV